MFPICITQFKSKDCLQICTGDIEHHQLTNGVTNQITPSSPPTNFAVCLAAQLRIDNSCFLFIYFGVQIDLAWDAFATALFVSGFHSRNLLPSKYSATCFECEAIVIFGMIYAIHVLFIFAQLDCGLLHMLISMLQQYVHGISFSTVCSIEIYFPLRLVTGFRHSLVRELFVIV